MAPGCYVEGEVALKPGIVGCCTLVTTLSIQPTLPKPAMMKNGLGGGICNFTGGTVTLKSTLIANNTVPIGGSGPDLSGTFNSQDYNLIENTNGATINSVMTHNLTGDILKLAPGLRCPQELFARPRSVWSP